MTLQTFDVAIAGGGVIGSEPKVKGTETVPASPGEIVTLGVGVGLGEESGDGVGEAWVRAAVPDGFLVFAVVSVVDGVAVAGCRAAI